MAYTRNNILYLKCTECVYGNVSIESELTNGSCCNSPDRKPKDFVDLENALRECYCKHPKLKDGIIPTVRT